MSNTIRRNKELAKIHIGKNHLNMDETTYKNMLWTFGRVKSSADLDEHGRHAIIKHLEKCGVTFSKRDSKRNKTGVATINQVAMINALWGNLVNAGVINDDTPAGLRKWLQNTTRRHHASRLGWTAPQFLPSDVARIVIEQLKKWCDRTEVSH